MFIKVLVVHLHLHSFCVLCWVKANELREIEKKPITKTLTDFHQ